MKRVDIEELNDSTQVKFIPYLEQQQDTYFSWCCLCFFKLRQKLNQRFNKPLINNLTIGECIIIFLGGIVISTIQIIISVRNKQSGTKKNSSRDEIKSITGNLAAIPLLLVLSLGSKNSIWSFLFGLSFEKILIIHKTLCYCICLNGFFHGYCMGFKNSGSGIAYLAVMCCFILFSQYCTRRWKYEWFYFVHITLTIAIFVLGIAHGIGAAVVGYALLGIDILLRLYFFCKYKHLTKEVRAIALNAGVTKLEWIKDNFTYSSGQFIYICIPSIGYFQWHPISISSAPHQKFVRCFIKSLGNWSSALYTFAQNNTNKQIKAYVSGPYGNVSIDLESPSYEHFIFVSGGIGLTPMQSVCSQLLFQQTRQMRPIKKITFIWSIREVLLIKDILDIHLSSSNLITASTQQKSDMQNPGTVLKEEVMNLKIHLTQKNGDAAALKQVLQEKKLQEQNIVQGRPNMTQYIEEMVKQIEQKPQSRIAVCVCGPKPMVEEVRSTVQKIQQQGGRVDFHYEEFEF